MSCAPRRAVRLPAVAALLALAACTDLPTGPSLARTAAVPVRHPVLFVHGWNSSASTWNTMLTRFRNDGYTSKELHAFSYNTGQSNATTAAIIRSKVDSLLKATGATQVDIVTHSMGALSARYYVRHLGGDGKVDALVSLGGANHGTTTAYACFQTSCLQMWPNSSFLNALNSTDETWGTPRYATWWSSCDEVINPSGSARLDGAVNTQTACLRHSALKEDAIVYAQVRTTIDPMMATIAAAP